MKRKQQATTSGEDYLEAILVLQMQKGTVRSVDVARHMEVSVSAHNFRKKRAFFVKGATVATKCINKSRTILKRSSGSSLLVLA